VDPGEGYAITGMIVIHYRCPIAAHRSMAMYISGLSAGEGNPNRDEKGR
jgi:hypothetical protein